MAGDHAGLVRQLLSAREAWIELSPGKAVRLRRPLEGELERMFRGEPPRFRIQLEDVVAHAVDWRGITESDLLGAGIGADEALPFDAEVWALAVGDNLDWLQAARQGLERLVADRLQARAAAQGNSAATSAPGGAPQVAVEARTA